MAVRLFLMTLLLPLFVWIFFSFFFFIFVEMLMCTNEPESVAVWSLSFAPPGRVTHGGTVEGEVPFASPRHSSSPRIDTLLRWGSLCVPMNLRALPSGAFYKLLVGSPMTVRSKGRFQTKCDPNKTSTTRHMLTEHHSSWEGGS